MKARSPSENKTYWFAAKECTVDEFAHEEHFKEAKERGIIYYCPDWATNAEIKEDDIALFGTREDAAS